MKYIALVAGFIMYIGQAYSQVKIFEDRFNDNANAWLVANHDKGRAEVKNGGYYLECKLDDKSYLVSFPKVSYKANEDFVVSFTVKWISGIDNNGYGICWGNKDTKNYICFYSTANGNFEVLQLGHDPEKIKPWTKSAAINIRGENKIKIVCKNKHYDFYINDLNVYSTSLILPESGDFYFKVNDPQVVMYDNFRIEKATTANSNSVEQKNTEPDKLPPSTAACNKTNRSFDELMYDSGTMTDADILKLLPEKQLLGFHSMYGLCMKINPLWTKNKKNVFGSTISFANDELKKLRATLPVPESDFYSFDITLALNPGGVDAKKAQIIQLVYDDLNTYFKVNGKTITPDEWTNTWVKRVWKSEYLTTDNGMRGELHIYNFPYVSPMGNGPEYHNVYLTSKMRVYYLIPQPDDKIIQVSIDLKKNFPSVKKPLPNDIGEFKMFNADNEKLFLDYLKSMLKTISREQ